VVLTSTANDSVTEFDLEFQNLLLSGQSGRTVNLLAVGQPSEFIHLNGEIDPLVTTTVPQDVYIAATATIPDGEFLCIGPGLNFSMYERPPSSVTITLPSPITVTGTSMALVLNLLVSKSATFPNCATPAFEGYSMAPTFTLSPFTLSSSPTNSTNGKFSGLEGQIASINSDNSKFSLVVTEGPLGTRTVSVGAGSGTVFQGISGSSALATGMFLNMDAALQPDGSLLATRIAVENPSAVNMMTGPVLQLPSNVTVGMIWGRQEQGPLAPGPNGTGSGYYQSMLGLDFSNAVFQISGQLANVQSLPFVASFNASNMVPGQNVDVSSAAFPAIGYPQANTVTLIPQTVNATVIGSSTSGAFTDYAVSLASYDLFATEAVQHPSQMEVYVDSNSQELNTQPVTPGGTFRFYGLVFNDTGTLRMDCAQVSDGVPFSTQSNASNQMTISYVETMRRETHGGMQQVTTTIAHP